MAQPGIAPTPGGSPWGRPPRLERGPGIIDLRTPHGRSGAGRAFDPAGPGVADPGRPAVGDPGRSGVGGPGRPADGGPFRFVPPPPAPPGQEPAHGDRRLGRFRIRTVAWRWVELAGALSILAVVALVSRPSLPATGPSTAWETKASPAVAALAEDLAVAGRQSTIDAATSARLQRDVAGLEAAGTPPADVAAAWNRVVGRVRLAVGEVASDPAATRSDLQLAELEVLALSRPDAAAAPPTGRQ